MGESGCFLAALPNGTRIEMRGADRASFLHNLCTNDIKRLQPGTGCEAFITDVRGKTIGHVNVFCHADRLTMETVAEQAGVLIPHFDKYLITEDVELLDISPGGTAKPQVPTDASCVDSISEASISATTVNLAVWGPAAVTVLKEIGLPAPPLPYQHERTELDGESIWVRRDATTGEDSYSICTGNASRDRILNRFADAGVDGGSSMERFESARIAAGWPTFGQDFGPENFPQELNRDATAISFTKGCYLGQETIARIDALGHVNRRLVGLAFKRETPAAGTTLSVDGKEVGTLTSVAADGLNGDWSAIGLSMIRAEKAAIGTEIDCGGATALVVDLPRR